MLVSRNFDLSAGMCGAQPKLALSPTSYNVLIEGFRPMLLSDYWNSHTLGDTTHSMYCVQGNSCVICNGKPIVYTTAKLSCGDVAAQGSATVTIN